MCRRKRLACVLAGLVWMIGLGFGYVRLLAYSAKPGPVGSGPVQLPDSMRAWRSPGRSLVLMALHPRCSCSRASADELADVLGWTPQAFDLVLLMYAPAEPAKSDWPAATAPASLARFQPRIVEDLDGKTAERLGAETSGHVLVYDSADTLVFTGGLTPGRAHRGNTDGQQVIRDFLGHGISAPAARAKAPVFGCEIQDRPLSPAR